MEGAFPAVLAVTGRLVVRHGDFPTRQMGGVPIITEDVPVCVTVDGGSVVSDLDVDFRMGTYGSEFGPTCA